MRIRLSVGIVVVVSFLCMTALGQEITLPVQPTPPGNLDAINSFIQYVTENAAMLPWPDNPQNFGWQGVGNPSEVLSVAGWFCKSNGDVEWMVLVSLPSNRVTMENYTVEGNRFVGVLRNFYTDRRVAEKRGEVRSHASFITALSEQEQIATSKIITSAQQIYEGRVALLYAAHPTFQGVSYSIGVFNKKRVLFFSADVTGSDGLVDSWKFVEYPLDKIFRMSEKDVTKTAAEIFKKVADFLASTSKK